MSFKINKIYTDNPYVDEMVYYSKLLAADTVLKLKDRADQSETAESLKAGDLYVSCIEGTAIIEGFQTISTLAFHEAGIYDPELIRIYSNNPAKIPTQTREKITKALIREYIANYEEHNPYYRMLHGLPPIGREDYIEDWVPPENVQIQMYLPDDKGNLTIPKPIHLYTENELAILDHYGVIDDIIDSDPDKYEYMRHLGSKAIDYYLARRANRFDVLYIPKVESEAIYQMYRDKIDENKFYVLRTIYSEAYKYSSDYYDNMISIFIVLITMIDIISRVQEFITRKEIFDIRSVQYIFQSNGIPFFGEIPLKYQISMVKNLHTLLKYKSTSKCMVDICSIFGFNNIKIFKYYLLKDRQVTSDGKYKYAYNEDGSENLAEEYELKFIKLPLDEDLDSYIRDRTNHYDYDEIISQDPTWNGGKVRDEVYKAILKEEFNLARTKYMSIDSIVDIAKASIQQSYFFGMLYDDVHDEDYVTTQVPYIAIGREFKVADLFTLLTALTYKYNGYVDQIVESNIVNTLYVTGFNFKADLGELASYIANSNIRDNEKSIATELVNRFQGAPATMSFKQMMEIYVNNLEIRDELVEGMVNADNKEIYNVYKKLYDSLMIYETALNHYRDENGNFYKEELTIDGETKEYITYTAFLNARDKDLYTILKTIDNYADDNAKEQYIASIVDNVIYALESYIDSTKFQSLFSDVPAMNADAAKRYIVSIINFYKSYKVDFLGINTIYTIDDKLDAAIRLIDNADLARYFDKIDQADIHDTINSLTAKLNKNEKISLFEKIYMDIYSIISKYYKDSLHSKDDNIVKYDISLVTKSIISTYANIARNISRMSGYDNIPITSLIRDIRVDTALNDGLHISDKVWIYPDGVIENLIDPYMDYTSGADSGKILVADEIGDVEVSAYISENVSDDDIGLNTVTEEAAAAYIDSLVVPKDRIKHSISVDNASDDSVLSEKAIIEGFAIITSKDLPN